MRLFEKKEPVQAKQGLICEATDYSLYSPNMGEKVLWFFIAAVIGAVVAYIFYELWWMCVIFAVICGFAFIPMRTKQVIKKRQKKLTLQFRGLLEALSTSIGAGKNIYDSFTGAINDLAIQFGADADIVREVQIIRLGLDNNIQVEDMLLNFAERSGLEDVQNFANVFATCYKKGGNIKEVIKNTTGIIGDKIEIQMELETMVSGQKTEQNIMFVMPVIFIMLMKSMGGDLIDLSSNIGRLSVTAAIGIFVIAYFISRKILDIKL